MTTLYERIADAIEQWATDHGLDLENKDTEFDIVSTLQEVLSAWESKPEEDE